MRCSRSYDQRTKFISEDDLDSFEIWLKYQRVNPTNPDELAEWRASFEEEKASKSAKVGLMKLESRPMAPGEYRYGVAVRDEDANLWLTLWVRRSPKPDYFIMMPRGDRGWNPHTSYHVDGRLHSKSFRHIIGRVQKRQVCMERSGEPNTSVALVDTARKALAQ
jgi:hypothetical protein